MTKINLTQDKAKAPADGNWHVVKRRGLFYVEATFPDAQSFYAQVGYGVRNELCGPVGPRIFAFHSAKNANRCRLALMAERRLDAKIRSKKRKPRL